MTLAKSTNQHQILQDILAEAQMHRAQGKRFLTVFDLDSTLLDLRYRVEMILRSFAHDPLSLQQFSTECKMLEQIQVHGSDWAIQESLDRIGITKARFNPFCEAIQRHWETAFFSNDYLQHDEPVTGAVAYVKALESVGAEIMYLTGRDAPRMKTGTEKSLLERGFPLNAPQARLILKPVAHLDDAAFKVTILKEALKTFARVWLFENEPVNLNLVAKMCPEVGLVFIDSTHSGREHVAETLDRIAHFETSSEDFSTAADSVGTNNTKNFKA